MQTQRRGLKMAMSTEEVDAFLEQERVCRVSTLGRDGTPRSNPLWFVWHDGCLWLYSLVPTQRWANIERNPSVSALIDAGHDYGELRGVELIGKVTVVGTSPARASTTPTSRLPSGCSSVSTSTRTSPSTTAATPGSGSSRSRSSAGTSGSWPDPPASGAVCQPWRVVPPDEPSQTRAKILEVAASLLARFTVSKLTMEDVARAAGIARQTIYKHFSGKDDLLSELFVQQMELNQYPVLRKLNDRPSPEALLRLFMTELNLARATPCSTRSSIRPSAPAWPNWFSAHRR